MVGVDQYGRRDGRPDPVVFELTEAFRAGRVVVPVLLGGHGMPPTHRLPHALQRLPDLNAAHVRTESADADIAHLVDRLPPSVPRPQRPVPRDVPPTRPPARSGVGRFVGCLLALALALAVLGALAWGGVTLWDKLPSLPPGFPGASDPVLTLSPNSGPTGTTVTATATGFRSGATVRFYFDLQDVSVEEADGDGRVTTTFTVPGGYTARRNAEVKASEWGWGDSKSALFTVTE
jgi:hypothetical protein